MRLLALLETTDAVWYHGTPEMQKIANQFEGRTHSVSYITDPEQWEAIQQKAQQVEHGSDEYYELLNLAGKLNQYKTVRSPVFLSNSHGVAHTYADDRRAFDYQNAEPGVIQVTVADGQTLTINGYGQNFRGIAVESVSAGLIKAGISETEIDSALAQFINQIRGDGNKISTDSLAAIVDGFGFDIVDVTGIKDNYNGGGPTAIVRMVMDPSLITRI